VNSFKIVLRIVFIIYYYIKIIKVIITESRATLIILHLLVIPMEQANRKYIYFYFYNYTTRTYIQGHICLFHSKIEFLVKLLNYYLTVPGNILLLLLFIMTYEYYTVDVILM